MGQAVDHTFATGACQVPANYDPGRCCCQIALISIFLCGRNEVYQYETSFLGLDRESTVQRTVRCTSRARVLSSAPAILRTP